MQNEVNLNVEQEIIQNSTDEARKFEGVFIPASIWLSKELTLTEKAILVEIKSLSKKNGYCFASNDYLSRFTGAAIRTISQTVTMFKEAGLIDVIFDGRKRYIKLNDDYELKIASFTRPDKASKKCKSAVQINADSENDSDKASKKCKSDLQKMQPYNNSIINIDNISTISNSNKFELSTVDTGSDEPSAVSYEQNEFIHNENPMGMSCYEEEKNNQKINACAREDASDETAAAQAMQETIDVSEEQSDVDKLNAMKKFKGTPKPAKPKKTTPFQKCIKMIYDSNNSDEVKQKLIEFLKSLSQYRTITESAFEIILENLDKAVAECPYPKDEGLMNYLKLHVIKSSHGKGYRDFYPIKSFELTQLISDYRGTSLGQSAANKFDTAKSIIYDENDPNHKLATNPDGSPMIF